MPTKSVGRAASGCTDRSAATALLAARCSLLALSLGENEVYSQDSSVTYAPFQSSRQPHKIKYNAMFEGGTDVVDDAGGDNKRPVDGSDGRETSEVSEDAELGICRRKDATAN